MRLDFLPASMASSLEAEKDGVSSMADERPDRSTRTSLLPMSLDHLAAASPTAARSDFEIRPALQNRILDLYSYFRCKGYQTMTGSTLGISHPVAGTTSDGVPHPAGGPKRDVGGEVYILKPKLWLHPLSL